MTCPDTHKHAVNSTCHRHHGCRCDPCREAAALRKKRQRRQTAYGRHRGPVDARGTIRRIQGLYYIGWRREDIVAITGHDCNILQKATTTRWVHPKTHDSISHAFEVLMRRGLGPSQRTANIARRRGYVSPYAWDSIDHDPEPTGIEKQAELRAEELLDEIDWLVKAQTPAHEIARAVNKSLHVLERHAWRYGRNDLAMYLHERSVA